MASCEGLDKLLFDLASESRLGILRELRINKLKMAEVARKMDLTATENFRQLQRLSEAKLIAKNPDGEYTLSEYGKLVLHLLPALDFTHKNREYFLSHNIWTLPNQFVNRVSELGGAILSLDTIENVNRAAHMVAEAEKYVWGLGDKALESVGPAMVQGIHGGVKFRFMFQESLLPRYKPLLEEMPAVEKRTLTVIPGLIFCTEKEAVLCLQTTDGRMDYTGFFGQHPAFVNWTADLFRFYWEKATRCLP